MLGEPHAVAEDDVVGAGVDAGRLLDLRPVQPRAPLDHLDDPLKVKQMRRGLSDLAEEGVIRLFKPAVGSNWIVGVVGELQLDVMRTRMEHEYGVILGFEESPFEVARWLRSKDPAHLKRLIDGNRGKMADDQDGEPVLMMRNAWEFGRFVEDWPEVEFLAVRERT